VPPRLWTARMDRRVHRARPAGQSGIDIPEFSAAGVLVWRADLPGAGPRRRPDGVRPSRPGTGGRCGCVASPAPQCSRPTSVWGRWASTTGARSPPSPCVGSPGSWAADGRSAGRCPVGWGAVAGAAVGWAAWWVFLLVARRRIIGRPVDVTDPEVMALVVQLAETGRRAADLHLPETDLDFGWTATQVTYQVVDPHLTDDQFIQLRYQAQLLDHAVGQALRAQANLDAATAIADDRPRGRHERNCRPHPHYPPVLASSRLTPGTPHHAVGGSVCLELAGRLPTGCGGLWWCSWSLGRPPSVSPSASAPATRRSTNRSVPATPKKLPRQGSAGGRRGAGGVLEAVHLRPHGHRKPEPSRRARRIRLLTALLSSDLATDDHVALAESISRTIRLELDHHQAGRTLAH